MNWSQLQDERVVRVLIIDRFEGDLAIIEDGNKTFNLPRKLLPKGAREGSVILVRVSVDREATAARENRVRRLAADLFRD